MSATKEWLVLQIQRDLLSIRYASSRVVAEDNFSYLGGFMCALLLTDQIADAEWEAVTALKHSAIECRRKELYEQEAYKPRAVAA
jgi:hypothetical protein